MAYAARILGPPSGITVTAPVTPEFSRILTPQALAFLARLQREFGERRDQLLARRAQRQRALDAGERFDFLPETAAIRAADWTVAPCPADLADRRVEITGPVERKMAINALNSGANVFMADFEDSLTPTWTSLLQGQINLRDAVRRTIRYDSPEGRHYELRDEVARLMVRPRGWHLPTSSRRRVALAVCADVPTPRRCTTSAWR